MGGALCVIAQILIDKTKLTPARILVGFVVVGVILGALGIYPKIVEFAGWYLPVQYEKGIIFAIGYLF